MASHPVALSLWLSPILSFGSSLVACTALTLLVPSSSELYQSLPKVEHLLTMPSRFFPSVVQTLEFNREITLVLTAPPYLLCVVVMIINGFHSDKVSFLAVRIKLR